MCYRDVAAMVRVLYCTVCNGDVAAMAYVRLLWFLYYCTVCYRDVAAMARAAVNGDEAALDFFNWRKGGKLSAAGPTEALSFFIGCENGEQIQSYIHGSAFGGGDQPLI